MVHYDNVWLVMVDYVTIVEYGGTISPWLKCHLFHNGMFTELFVSLQQAINCCHCTMLLKAFEYG